MPESGGWTAQSINGPGAQQTAGAGTLGKLFDPDTPFWSFGIGGAWKYGMSSLSGDGHGSGIVHGKEVLVWPMTRRSKRHVLPDDD